MDIQIKTKFEQLEYIKEKLEYLNFDEYLGCYVEKVSGKPVGSAAWMNGAWYGFEQAAKANAVPEGYKLVPIDSVAVNKKEIPAIREALHIMNFKHGDVRGDFASADAAIEKAIEATQEPAND